MKEPTEMLSCLKGKKTALLFINALRLSNHLVITI